MDIDKITELVILGRKEVYLACKGSPDPFGIGQKINGLSYATGLLSDYLGDKTKEMNDAKAETYLGMVKAGATTNAATEASRHEHKSLEGECARLKLLLDSGNARITAAQTILKTLDVERNIGGTST